MQTIHDLLSKCLPFRRNTCLLALGLAFAAGSAVAASSTATSTISVASSTPNVLLVIIDDIGPRATRRVCERQYRQRRSRIHAAHGCAGCQRCAFQKCLGVSGVFAFTRGDVHRALSAAHRRWCGD